MQYIFIFPKKKLIQLIKVSNLKSTDELYVRPVAELLWRTFWLFQVIIKLTFWSWYGYKFLSCRKSSLLNPVDRPALGSPGGAIAPLRPIGDVISPSAVPPIARLPAAGSRGTPLAPIQSGGHKKSPLVSKTDVNASNSKRCRSKNLALVWM